VVEQQLAPVGLDEFAEGVAVPRAGASEEGLGQRGTSG